MPPEMLKLLGEIAVALSPVIVALVGMLAAYLAKMIKGKVDNQLVEKGLLMLNDGVWTVVKEMEQTMASEFKKAAADGKLTDDEKRALKSAALMKLKSFVSLDELARLLGLGKDAGAVENLIDSKVEAAVHDLKEAKALLPKQPSA